MQNEYIVAGLMSGTSLDGIDLAVCSFRITAGKWDFSLLYSKTFEYSVQWRNRLATAHLLEGKELVILDREYGALLSSVVIEALEESGLHPLLIASHGHTVFHAPEQGYTLQIGSGAEIAAATGIQVVYDFRSLDVALGGHGAPLVPVGDKYLFYEYDACLNLGGFSNISFDSGGKRIAFDICPVNIALNFLVSRQGKLYDEDGMAGRKGNLNPGLLADLDELNYYKESFPKSLSREWLEKEFVPLLINTELQDPDIMATLYHHMARQIQRVFSQYSLSKVLVTGGGVHNKFLIDLVRKAVGESIILPGKELIDYKEALVFAFLGLLRYRGEINCLSSVTGAGSDSSAGILVG